MEFRPRRQVAQRRLNLPLGFGAFSAAGYFSLATDMIHQVRHPLLLCMKYQGCCYMQTAVATKLLGLV